jgi:hypothetical protein
MSDHISLERTHDLIDGLLSSEAAERARHHMAVCAGCRERHAMLAELAADMRALPRDATPPLAVWEAISRRIEGTAPGTESESADVLVLPGVSDRHAKGQRRIAFTIPQLAAASLVMAVMSASLVWMAVSRPTQAPQALPTAAPTAVGAARFVSEEASYDTALDELVTIVEAARPFLAPETLIALDESIAEIDAAIAEIATALENDPSSDLLHAMLVNQQRSKLRVLSQVATLTEARS